MIAQMLRPCRHAADRKNFGYPSWRADVGKYHIADRVIVWAKHLSKYCGVWHRFCAKCFAPTTDFVTDRKNFVYPSLRGDSGTHSVADRVIALMPSYPNPRNCSINQRLTAVSSSVWFCRNAASIVPIAKPGNTRDT
jgi:hypothetical protein